MVGCTYEILVCPLGGFCVSVGVTGYPKGGPAQKVTSGGRPGAGEGGHTPLWVGSGVLCFPLGDALLPREPLGMPV